VKQFRESIPLFQRYQIEAQLDAMFMPTVTLKSGGYIVINQTEALVSIDVNSGKATREHSIEDTAYKTNLEAAEEIGRQLRLRDLAGLIVIDFIDMEDSRNDRNVEKKLRDCIKNDRARIQIGKISQFGLLEMSRQRLRAGVVAGSTVPCPHCGGQGIVRSVESTTLRLLRGLEEESQRQRAAVLKVRAPTQVAIYALNQKRREIAHVETEYGISIQFEPNDTILTGTFEIDRIGSRPADERPKPVVAEAPPDPVRVAAFEDPEIEVVPEEEGEEPRTTPEPVSAPQNGTKRRRRRRRGRDRAPVADGAHAPHPAADAAPFHDQIQQEEAAANGTGSEPEHPSAGEGQTGGEAGAPRKRRRRRRGRRGTRENGASPSSDSNAAGFDSNRETENSGPETSASNTNEHAALHAPHLPAPAIIPNAPSEPVWSLASDDQRADIPAVVARANEPVSRSVGTIEDQVREDRAPATIAEAEPQKPASEPAGPARKGWWQRPFRAK
jgi:ribonuclease E